MNRTNITRIELTLDEVRQALLNHVVDAGVQFDDVKLNQVALKIIPRANDDRLLVDKIVFTVYENEAERKKEDHD